jgi:histidine triad (HIT) family protein
MVEKDGVIVPDSMLSDYSENCDFCDIARGREPARIVFEDSQTMAFFPVRPVVPGHTLVIPRKHIPDIWSVQVEDADLLTRATLRIAKAIETSLAPDGLNVINSTGEAASQTVFHFHVHLVPRMFGDVIGRIWPPSEPIPAEVKDEVLSRLRDASAKTAYR